MKKLWSLVAIAGLILSSQAQAFYQWQDDEAYFEARGFFRATGLLANNPNDALLFERDEVEGLGLFGRLMLDYERGPFSAEMHLVQHYINDDFRTGGSRLSGRPGIDRSDGLHWQYDDGHAELVFDRLNVSYESNDFRFKLGRQPINLATTFYFTPNDFFVPFAAQTFFRTYKAGVDAARLTWQWSDYSQLELISVLSYDIDEAQPTLRNTSPDWSNTGYLARISTLTDNFEYGLVIAHLKDTDIIGFDFQGELYWGIGLRGEGHIKFANDEVITDRDSLVSIALDKRWPNTFVVRLEHFYHRLGADDSDDYRIDINNSNDQFYLARNYTALGANYEMSPLWLVDGVWLYNHQDSSKLLALYSTYSLSDESELSVGMNIPIGEQPELGQLNTEFGSLPHSLTMEYRLYF